MTTLYGSKMPFVDLLVTPFVKLKDLLTPSEDYWTWVTLDGKVYEDVMLIKLDRDHAIISHSFGTATIAKSNLSEQVRYSLIHDLDASEQLDAYGLEGRHAEALPIEHAESFSKVA